MYCLLVLLYVYVQQLPAIGHVWVPVPIFFAEQVLVWDAVKVLTCLFIQNQGAGSMENHILYDYIYVYLNKNLQLLW
jgi:hypothetical protein